MSTTFSPEMNWVPRAHPMGYRSYKEADKVCSKVNQLLDILFKRFGACAVAKPDLLHPTGGEEDEHGETHTYSIEVVPASHFYFIWVNKFSDNWPLFKQYLDTLFLVMKGLGLAPSIKRTKKGVTTYYSGGGMHIHCGADLFAVAPNFYTCMEQFHRNIAVDYANHPEIRWLFSDWMSDKAHHLIWRPDMSKKLASFPKMEDYLFHRLVNGSYAIEPRFMKNSKGSYLTFEFRFFRMVENAEELRLAVLFVEAWVAKISGGVCLGSEPVKFTMNRRKWKALMDPNKAWRAISAFLESIGLNPEDYRVFFERNYLMRLKHGKMD